MNQGQLERLLSSACSTHGAILRAQKAVERIRVTSQVIAHMNSNGVPDAVSRLKDETRNTLRATGNSVNALSDDWAAFFNVIRGASTRLKTRELDIVGKFLGLWPAELLGYMMVMLHAPVITSTSGPGSAPLPTTDELGILTYRITGDWPRAGKDRIDPSLFSDPFLSPAEIHAFLLPIQAIHRHYVEFSAA